MQQTNTETVNIDRPVGLNNVCAYIQEICSQAQFYSRGVVPSGCIIRLDRGCGRTTVTQYAADMFRAAGVMSFASGMDDFISLRYDGSYSNYLECRDMIDDAAVYDNVYRGLYDVDFIDLAQHPGETQYEGFLRTFAEINRWACVFFFIPTSLNSAQERLVRKLEQAADGLKRIDADPYSAEDHTKLVRQFLGEYGAVLKETGRVRSLLERAVQSIGPRTVDDSRSIAESLLRRADYSREAPEVGEAAVRALLAESPQGADEMRDAL